MVWMGGVLVWGQLALGEATTLHLVASGDTLVHRRVKKTAQQHRLFTEAGTTSNNDGYDWILEDVAPVFREADIGFVNLETPTDPAFHRSLQGEILNAPLAFLDALSFAGINVVSFANNHSYDQGLVGLQTTIREAQKRNMLVVGAGNTCAEAQEPKQMKVKGLTVAFLGMTDLLNIQDNTHPNEPCVWISGLQCRENCFPDRDAIWYGIDEESLLRSIQEAKSKADVLVFSFHWGIEYTQEPLELYTQLAPKMIDAGVDVLLGHHAHTLQPVVKHKRQDGSEGIIAYGLGNLFSDMGRRYGAYPENPSIAKTRDGMLLSLKIHVDKSEEKQMVSISKVEAVPIWTENESNSDTPNIRVRRHQTILNADPSKKDFLEGRRKEMNWLPLQPLE